MRKFMIFIASAAFATLSGISAASAHTELDNTSPKANAVVTLAPSIIQLTFNEAPLPDGSQVALSDAKGNAIETEAAQVDGATVTVLWPIDMPTGLITVNWRAVADDGHVVQGTYSFTYSPTDGTTPTESASAAPSIAASVDASATPIAVTASAPADDASKTSRGLSFGVTATVLIVAGGLLILLFAKRK
jgi:methionine-rich copper-binding protein CopC